MNISCFSIYLKKIGVCWGLQYKATFRNMDVPISINVLSFGNSTVSFENIIFFEEVHKYIEESERFLSGHFTTQFFCIYSY